MLNGSRILPVIRICLIVCGISMLCSIASAKPEEARLSYRSVIVRVVNERGEPMPGVKVQLLGTGRDALQAMDIGSQYNELGVWSFISDAHGRCTVRLGCFKGFDSAKLAGKDVPGWGRYYFIAETGRLRGVSQPVVHESEGKRAKDHYADEWNRNGAVRTSDKPVAVTLRMRRGLRVLGRVIDTAGKPMRDFDIGIHHDLGSEHHTGYGNEIFRQSTATNEDGRFVLKDIFPNTFYVGGSMEEARLPVWVRTNLRGKWWPEAVDMITPRRGERVIRMTLVVSRTLPYRYTGRIVDDEGKPVSGAEVVLGVSRHRKVRTYEDSHQFLETKSDDDGRFEIRTATPFIPFVSVKAGGFAEYMEDYFAKDAMKVSDKWNITLHRP